MQPGLVSIRTLESVVADSTSTNGVGTSHGLYRRTRSEHRPKKSTAITAESRAVCFGSDAQEGRLLARDLSNALATAASAMEATDQHGHEDLTSFAKEAPWFDPGPVRIALRRSILTVLLVSA